MFELLSIWGYYNLAETFILCSMLIIHSSGHVKNEIDSGLGYISRGEEGGGGREGEGGEDDNFYQHIFPVEEF